MSRLPHPPVDTLGATRYTYDAVGQRLTGDGPFDHDTVTSTYSNRRRVALSLQQPTASWTNGFGWDTAALRRLLTIRSSLSTPLSPASAPGVAG